MSDRLLEAARKRGLMPPPSPHTPAVLGELAAAMYVRPLRSGRRSAREEAYLATASRCDLETSVGRVVTWEWGRSGEPLVVLVHGWEGQGSQLGAFAVPLVHSGFRVAALDAPAHGESGGDEAHVPLLARLLVELEGRMGPVHALVGHSMGAAAAAMAASIGLNPRALVLLAPPLSQLDRVERIAQRLQLEPAVRAEFLAAVERRTSARHEEVDMMAVARLAPCPLLVFHDPEDTDTSFADSERIVGGWRGARLVPCPGRGHYRMLATPEVVQQATQFLVEHRAQPGCYL